MTYLGAFAEPILRVQAFLRDGGTVADLAERFARSMSWRSPRGISTTRCSRRGPRHCLSVVGVLAGREYDDCATLSHVVVDVVLMERDVE